MVNDQDQTWLAELGLSACTETARDHTVAELARFHTRPPTPTGCIFESNVVYGVAGRPPRPLCLDVYRRVDGATVRPGVLFVHGGSWAEGHRYAHIRRACLLAAEGWVTATMSYRLSGEARWPAQIVDVKCALRWMRAESHWLGLDPSRLAVAGSSAGGHLAAMAALSPGRFRGDDGGSATQHDSHSDEVSAAVLWYPVTDLNASKAFRDPVFALIGSRRRRRLGAASPVSNVLAGAPPILSMTGERDDLVPVSSVVRFHEELTRAGIRNQLHVYPDAGHAFNFHPVSWNDSYVHCRDFLCDVLGPLG